jgi:hypothetical protein
VAWISGRRIAGIDVQVSPFSAAPIVFPRSYPQQWQTEYLIALGQSLDILRPDHSWTVLLDVRDHQDQIGLGVEAATGDTSGPI